LNISPELFINMDETGCVSKPDKNIKMKCVVHLDSRVFPRKKENTDYRHISIISAITLDGESLKPMVIVPRKRYEKEIENERWYSSMEYSFSESGYNTIKNMHEWVINVFAPYVLSIREELGQPDAPCILIMDNLTAHGNSDVMNLFNNIGNIYVVFLPPHSSHFMHALDLLFFGVFKKFYKSLRSENPSDSLVGKLSNIHKALYYASYFSTIQKSFRRAGFSLILNCDGNFSIQIVKEKQEKIIKQGTE